MTAHQAPTVIDRPRPEEITDEAKPIILRKWGWHSERTHLYGRAYGHPRFPDGEPVITTRVQWIDEQLGIARTRNTTYILQERA